MPGLPVYCDPAAVPVALGFLFSYSMKRYAPPLLFLPEDSDQVVAQLFL